MQSSSLLQLNKILKNMDTNTTTISNSINNVYNECVEMGGVLNNINNNTNGVSNSLLSLNENSNTVLNMVTGTNVNTVSSDLKKREISKLGARGDKVLFQTTNSSYCLTGYDDPQIKWANLLDVTGKCLLYYFYFSGEGDCTNSSGSTTTYSYILSRLTMGSQRYTWINATYHNSCVVFDALGYNSDISIEDISSFSNQTAKKTTSGSSGFSQEVFSLSPIYCPNGIKIEYSLGGTSSTLSSDSSLNIKAYYKLI